jgi:phage baseplate assembly protein W
MTTSTDTRVCRRCHGSGREPARPEYGRREQLLLDKLAELGSERAQLQAHRAYMRTDGRARLSKIYEEVRKLIDRATELKIQSIDMQDALQVSPAAFYKIKNGLTGN